MTMTKRLTRLLAPILLLFAATVSTLAQSGTVGPAFKQQWFTDTGVVCASCTLTFSATGTSTPLDTYTDSTLATPNANPLTLDAAGRVSGSNGIFLTPGLTYRVVLKTSGAATIWTQDGISGPNSVTADRLRVSTHSVTLASDAFTATYSQYAVDTQGGAGTDDLSTITAGTGVGAGFLLILTPANVSHVVTAKDSVGNIKLAGGDFALDSAKKSLTLYYDGGSWVEVARASSGNTVDNTITDGRCTLTTVVGVTTSDVTAATTVRYTPYKGNRIALYDGSTTWNLRTFTELSLSLGSDAANTNYDLFVFDSGGTATLERLAWTNDTTRATALALQDGVEVKTGATTRKYVCTYRTTGTIGQTEDSKTKRYVWNRYHKVPRDLLRSETTASWTYTTNAWRQANAATANQVDVVIGLAEDVVSVRAVVQASNSTGGIAFAVGIGLDSTTTPAAGNHNGVSRQVASQETTLSSFLEVYPGIGKHSLVWLERSTATGTTTWYATGGGSLSFLTDSGLSGWVWG